MVEWRVVEKRSNGVRYRKFIDGKPTNSYKLELVGGDPIIDEQVGANLDDVTEKESDGAIDDSATSVAHVSNTVNTGRYWGAHRWVSGSLPAMGDTIDVAYVELYLWSVIGDNVNGNWHFEKVAGPAQFTTDAYDVTSRDRTTASASWIADSLATGWQQTPSLKDVLQEVIDSYSPTAIVLIFRPNQDAAKSLWTRPYNYDTDLAAKLHIEYTVGGQHYDRSGTALLGLVGAGTRPIGCVRSDTALLGLFAGIGGIYEYYNTGESNDAYVYGAIWKGQTFTPTATHKITSVKLELFRLGSPGTITVGIRATDEYGLPTGNDLCSGTTNGDTLPTESWGEWREITLGDGYNLVADTKYAIVVRATAGDIDNCVRWADDDTAPSYSGGNGVSSGQSGAPGTWTAQNDRDYMFEEWATFTSRTTALLRTDTLSLGLKATASRIITPVRAQTALLGLKATASEAVDYAAKTGTALLGLVATGSRAIALSRSKTVLLGLKATGVMSTLGHYTKEGIVYLGLAVTGTRSIVLARADTALLGLKATATKAITLTRADTALLGLKTQANVILPYIRTGTVYLGLKITASRSFALTRLDTALLGLKVVATRSLVLSRAKTALLGLKVIGKLGAPGRALKLIIITSQNRKLNVITSLYRKIKIFTE